MNIYELLRKLVEARQWTDQERADGVRLLDDLERLSVLGTMAGKVSEQNHACVAADVWFPGSVSCTICGKPLDPPPHSCVPKEFESGPTWGGSPVQTIVKCAICGRGME